MLLFPWTLLSEEIRAVLQNLNRLLSSHGGLYLVGGVVRDVLWQEEKGGKESFKGDIDLAYEGDIFLAKVLLEQQGFSVESQGLAFGSLRVKWKKLPGQQGIFDVTAFRHEDGYRAWRYPNVSYNASLLADASRRDFTINALYVPLFTENKEVLDPLGEGLSDLRQKRLRFIGEPKERLKEDYVRLLRYFRFWAKGQTQWPTFWHDVATLKDIEFLSGQLKEVSGPRCWKELKGFLEAPSLLQPLKHCLDSGVWGSIFAMQGEASTDWVTLFNGSERELWRVFDVVAGPKQRQLSAYSRLGVLLSLVSSVFYQEWFKRLGLSRLEQRKICFFTRVACLLFSPAQRDSLQVKTPKVFCRILRYFWQQALLEPNSELGDVQEGILLGVMSGFLKGGLSQKDVIHCMEEKISFPFSGQMIMARGIQGEEVGKVLKWLQEEWVRQGVPVWGAKEQTKQLDRALSQHS